MLEEKFDLDIKSPSYEKYLSIQNESRILYDGLIEDIKSLLYKTRTSEQDSLFNSRKDKIVYDNLYRPIIHSRIGLLTRKKLEISCPVEIEPLINNLDGAHLSLDEFAKNIALDADVDGIAWAIVDMPSTLNTDEQGNKLVNSRADEIAFNIRPYVRLLKRGSVINYSYNSIDKSLDWVVLKVNISEPPKVGKKIKDFTVWVVWDKQKVSLYKKEDKGQEYILYNEAPHSLGEVPIVPFYGVKTDLPYTGLPFGYMINSHIKRILNLSSQLDFSLDAMTMPRMYVVASGKPDTIPEQTDAFFMPYGPNGEEPKIGYAEPSGRGVELGKERIKDLIDTVYRITLYMTKKATAQIQSADSQREENTVLKADLSSVALNHENSLKSVVRLLYKWAMGRQPDENSFYVRFSRDFDSEKLSAQEQAQIREDYFGKLFSLETTWERLRHGEILPEGFDPEIEKQALLNEGSLRESNFNINQL